MTGIIIVAVIGVALGFVGRSMFIKNEEKVIDLQRKEREFMEKEQDVPEAIETDLKKSYMVSTNYKKLELVSFTIAITVVVVGLVKMLIM